VAATYSKSPHSSNVDLALGVSDNLISRHTNKHARFKAAHQYGKADAICKGLHAGFGILVGDRLAEGSAGGDFNKECNAWREARVKDACQLAQHKEAAWLQRCQQHRRHPCSEVQCVCWQQVKQAVRGHKQLCQAVAVMFSSGGGDSGDGGGSSSPTWMQLEEDV
jgi:hypothetical protein